MFPTKINFPNMTLLRQFVEVAEEDGIARAARKLNISQPALSKNLKRLEETVGGKLFERHAKGTVLTAAGEALYRRSLKIILDYEHAIQDVQNALSDDAGLLRIGAGPVFSSTIIPAAIPLFHAHYPTYRISVQNRLVEDAERDLELGRIDMVAGLIIDKEREDTFVRPVRHARLAILCSKDHPLAERQSPVSLAEIAAHPFVSFRPDHDLIRKLGQVLADNGAPPPRYMVETSSIFGTVELLRGGRFLMFGSSLLADYPLGHGLVVLETEVEFNRFTMGFLMRKGDEQVPAYRGFMNIVQREVMRGADHVA